MAERTSHVVCPVVSLVNQRLVTTSLNVAEVFGKRHDHVLRAIRDIRTPQIWGVPEDFGLSNFGQSSYTNAQGKDQPMFNLTRDGFTLLVMGFTGRRAMQFKIAYIEAFNRMEAALAQMQAEPAGDGPAASGLVTPEILQAIRRAQRGIRLSIRVKLLDIVCQMNRIDEASRKSKPVILADYRMLCDLMREAGDAEEAGGADGVREFVAACCLLGADLSVPKEELYNAWRQYAAEQGLPSLMRPQFFQALYRTAAVRNCARPQAADGSRVYVIRGIALAECGAEEMTDAEGLADAISQRRAANAGGKEAA